MRLMEALACIMYIMFSKEVADVEKERKIHSRNESSLQFCLNKRWWVMHLTSSSYAIGYLG